MLDKKELDELSTRYWKQEKAEHRKTGVYAQIYKDIHMLTDNAHLANKKIKELEELLVFNVIQDDLCRLGINPKCDSRESIGMGMFKEKSCKCRINRETPPKED